jgi:hypothetical protein
MLLRRAADIPYFAYLLHVMRPSIGCMRSVAEHEHTV